MLFTICNVALGEGSYDGSNYSEPCVEKRVFFASDKKALYRMLRAEGFSPWEICHMSVMDVPSGDTQNYVTYPLERGWPRPDIRGSRYGY